MRCSEIHKIFWLSGASKFEIIEIMKKNRALRTPSERLCSTPRTAIFAPLGSYGGRSVRKKCAEYGGIWRDMAGYGRIWQDMGDTDEIQVRYRKNMRHARTGHTSPTDVHVSHVTVSSRRTQRAGSLLTQRPRTPNARAADPGDLNPARRTSLI